MGRIETSALIVSLLGCIGCASPPKDKNVDAAEAMRVAQDPVRTKEGDARMAQYRDLRHQLAMLRDVDNGCTVDIEPEETSNNTIGDLQVYYTFPDVAGSNAVLSVVFVDSAKSEPVYIGGVTANRAVTNRLEIRGLDTKTPTVWVNGTAATPISKGAELARYDGFGMQAELMGRKTIQLRIHKKYGVVLQITTIAPTSP